MCKSIICALVPGLLWLSSCQQVHKTEKEEISFWNNAVIDSASRLLYNQKDTTGALRYFDSILHHSEAPTLYTKAARYLIKANYYYFFTPDNKSTAAMIDAALDVYQSGDLQNHYPRTYVKLLLFGGNIAYRLRQYSKANEYYFRAKKLGDAHLDPCERSAFSYSIAMVLYRQHNFIASKQYFKEAYALQETCAPQTGAIVLQQQEIQSNIGLCFLQLKSSDSALYYFDRALELAERYKDSLGPVAMDRIRGVLYGNRARVAMLTNRMTEAEQLSRKSISLNDRDGYEKENALDIKLQLADIYGCKKEYAGMISLLRDMEEPIALSNSRMRSEWNRLMASYYEQIKQPGLGMPYLKSYFLQRDSILLEQEQLTSADVVRQLKDKEQQLQITVLKRDNQLAFYSLWVTILFSAMTVVIIYLVYQNYRRSKKSLAVSEALNKEIQHQKAARENEERQRHHLITEAVIRAQESERSLIGLELHDNINQVLTTVKLHNEMVLAGVGDAQTVLPRSLGLLQNCINEIRRLSKRLSAPTLGKISLEESVNDLIDSVNHTSKVKITPYIAGLEGSSLRKELHLGVYRILQEQLNNVLKHAEASEVSIHLERTGNYLRLTVADNGKGFLVQGTKKGIGLVNMQTRAESLNGSFEIDSQPGRGCKVKVVLPCLQ